MDKKMFAEEFADKRGVYIEICISSVIDFECEKDRNTFSRR